MSKSQLNSKSIARIAAIQTLYQFRDEHKTHDVAMLLKKMIEFYKDNDIKSDYEINKNSTLKLKPSINYLTELVNCTTNNIQEIDSTIKDYLTKDWNLNKLSKLLLAILRIAIGELKYFPETPRKVIINEYTDIANSMADSKEVDFVNSLLDNYAKK